MRIRNNKRIDYPNQDMLITAAKTHMPLEHHDKLLAHARLVGREIGIDAALKKWNIDVIIAPADSAYNLLVSAAGRLSSVDNKHFSCSIGYPSATMPLSYLKFNGRPIGLAAFTTKHREDTLLKVLSAWEATFPARRPPFLQGQRRK